MSYKLLLAGYYELLWSYCLSLSSRDHNQTGIQHTIKDIEWLLKKCTNIFGIIWWIFDYSLDLKNVNEAQIKMIWMKTLIVIYISSRKHRSNQIIDQWVQAIYILWNNVINLMCERFCKKRNNERVHKIHLIWFIFYDIGRWSIP